MSKFRNVCFTLNNYIESDFVDLPQLVTPDQLRFIAFAREVAPTTGTPHLQGYACANSPHILSWWTRKLQRCHIVPMRGSLEQNDEYISKMSEPMEFGDKPRSTASRAQATADRYRTAKELAKNGLLEEIEPEFYIKYYSTLKRIRDDAFTYPENLPNPCGIWIWGPPGTGKTRWVTDTYPNLYEKSCDDWWGGYAGEDTVLLDEFDQWMVGKLGTQLKHWADYKRFRAAFKGGQMVIRPKRFIVCSNNSIDTLFFSDITLLAAIKRRFNEFNKTSVEQNITI